MLQASAFLCIPGNCYLAKQENTSEITDRTKKAVETYCQLNEMCLSELKDCGNMYYFAL